MLKRITDFLNEEKRTDTMIIKGVSFVADVLVILAAIKFLL
jgi:hypothetical protein